MKPETLFNKNYVLCCISNLFFWMAFNIAVPVLPLYLIGDLGFSKSAAGLVVSLYFLSAVTSRPFAGPIVDRLPRKLVLAVTTALCALCISGYLVVVSVFTFAILRFFHGVFFGISSTSLTTVMVENVPPSKLGTGIGIFGVLSSLSMALAPMMGIMIMEHFSALAVFATAAGMAFASLVACVLIRVPRREPVRREGPLLRLNNLFFKRGFWPSFIYILIIFGYGMLSNYVSILALERGLEASTGIFFSCVAAGVMISRLFSGKMLDQGKTDQVVILGVGLALGSYILFMFAWSVPLFLLAGFGLGLGYGGCMPSFQAIVIRMARPEEVGTATSTFYLAMDLSIGLAALTGGMLADLTSMTGTYAICTLLGLLGLILYMVRIKGKTDLPQAE